MKFPYRLVFPAVLMFSGYVLAARTRIYSDLYDTKTIVEFGSGRVVFDREDSAKVCGWQINGREYVVHPELGHAFAKNMFWSPRRGGKLDSSRLTRTRDEADSVSLSFENRLRLSPFQIGDYSGEEILIAKHFRVHRNKPVLEIEYELKNAGRRPHRFSFWFHNWLDFGGEYTLVLPGGKGVMRYPLHAPAGKENMMFPAGDVPYSPGNEDFEKSCRLEPITGGILVMRSRATNEKFTMQADYDQVLQEYTNFSGSGCPTMELMFRLCTLNPGDTWRTKLVISLQGDNDD